MYTPVSCNQVRLQARTFPDAIEAHCIRTVEAGLNASLMGAGAEVALQASLLPLLWTNRTQEGQCVPRGIQTGRPQRDVCMEELPSRAEVQVLGEAQRAVTN